MSTNRLAANAGKQGFKRVVADDVPMLVFTPSKGGKYRIDVVMATCSDEPCRYGLQLNSK